jgi:hypothetical protein
MSSAAVTVARLTAFSRSLAGMKRKVLMLWSVLVVSGSGRCIRDEGRHFDELEPNRWSLGTCWKPECSSASSDHRVR